VLSAQLRKADKQRATTTARRASVCSKNQKNAAREPRHRSWAGQSSAKSPPARLYRIEDLQLEDQSGIDRIDRFSHFTATGFTGAEEV
jgi:hypothetical protein